MKNHIITILIMAALGGWWYGFLFVSHLFLAIPFITLAIGMIYLLIYSFVRDMRSRG